MASGSEVEASTTRAENVEMTRQFVLSTSVIWTVKGPCYYAAGTNGKASQPVKQTMSLRWPLDAYHQQPLGDGGRVHRTLSEGKAPPETTIDFAVSRSSLVASTWFLGRGRPLSSHTTLGVSRWQGGCVLIWTPRRSSLGNMVLVASQQSLSR